MAFGRLARRGVGPVGVCVWCACVGADETAGGGGFRTSFLILSNPTTYNLQLLFEKTRGIGKGADEEVLAVHEVDEDFLIIFDDSGDIRI